MPSGDEEDEVLVTTENGVTTLTMNRPERLNAWTRSMRDSLTESMRAAAADDATKVAVITGRGKYYRQVLHCKYHSLGLLVLGDLSGGRPPFVGISDGIIDKL